MAQVEQWRKKPIVIDAIQFDGSYEGTGRIIGWVNEHTPNFDQADSQTWGISHYYGELIIRTLEGEMTAQKGDWIIKGVKGEFYPCKPDIFAATYEPVAAHAPSVAPPPRGEKRPIARPCSACGDGDTEMKYHDHFPPFADEPGTPSVAEARALSEDELYSRHMAELEANWEVHPIPPEDRMWINGYKQGWQQHRILSAPALSESASLPELLAHIRKVLECHCTEIDCGCPTSLLMNAVRESEKQLEALPVQSSVAPAPSESESLAEIRKILSRWDRSTWSDAEGGLFMCVRTLTELREVAFKAGALGDKEKN